MQLGGGMVLCGLCVTELLGSKNTVIQSLKYFSNGPILHNHNKTKDKFDQNSYFNCYNL